MTDKLYPHEDITRMVHTAFNEEGGLRDEITEDIKREMKLGVLQVLAVFGVTTISGVIAFTVFVSGLRGDVDQLQDFANNQTATVLLEERIQVNTEAIKDAATGDDLQRVEETLIRLDERIRNSGI